MSGFYLDRISVFGRVILSNRVSSVNDNTNQQLRDEIALELYNASRNRSDEVFDVIVVELENTTNSNILCHYEVLLDIQSAPTTDLVANLSLAGEKFRDGLVALAGELRLKIAFDKI